MDLRWIMRALLTKTIENKWQRMIMIETKVCGSRVWGIILLMIVGHKMKMNVKIDDWMVGMVIRVPRTKRNPPSTCFTFPTNQLPVLPMFHSNLYDGTPFEFCSSHVNGQTIMHWDHCDFPCAVADSTVSYPSNTEVTSLVSSCIFLQSSFPFSLLFPPLYPTPAHSLHVSHAHVPRQDKETQ